jgi:hypothetical protein
MQSYALFPYGEFDKLFGDTTLDLDQLIRIIDWDNPNLKEIIQSNLLQMKTSFNDSTSFAETSKKDIIIKFDSETLFDAIEEIARDMILHESFESEILGRVSKVYDIYSQNDIISRFNLDSTIMFGNLVDWKTSFQDTLFTRLNEYESLFNRTFKEESNFLIHFTISNNSIQHITFNGDLKYKSCDASEWLEWTYSRLPYSPIESPKELKTQNMSPYYTIFKSHFDYDQK